MNDIVIELSILTPPKLIKVNHPKEYLDKIVVLLSFQASLESHALAQV
ncbi:hypothetical protein ES708_23681 [subsurface metagenome]